MYTISFFSACVLVATLARRFAVLFVAVIKADHYY